MIDNFIFVGHYRQAWDAIQPFLNEGVDKAERVSLVYMFVVEDEIKYIGKTIQGHIRPLSYHKNNVMVDVRDGIFNACAEGGIVKIYTRRFDTPLMFEGLELDICEAYEQALITKYKPAWNNHIR